MKKRLLACSLGASLIVPTVARAQQAADPVAAAALSAAPKPLFLAEEDAGRKPLMSAIDRTGGGEMMRNLGVDISGHYEGSYTWSFDNPPDDVIAGRVFDVQHDEYLTNQIDVAIQRTIEATNDAKLGYKDKYNVGFKFEALWGYDARFIHANGLFDHYNDDNSRNEEWDIVQAYAQVGMPIGNGLLVTLGKFVTPIGYETINPTTNPLFSHSYLFGFAIPFTHTGVTAKYNFTEELSVTGGVVRGWDQALEDNNDAVSFLFSAGYMVSDKINLTLNGITGPEQTDNNGRYRTVLDLIATYAFSDQLTLALNADYGVDASASAGGENGQWYGVAAYGQYKCNDQFAVNLRGEWFNDKDDVRGIGTNIYEATLGVAIKPFPNNNLGSNLVIRPEVRYDYAQEAFFDGGTDHGQFTAGADVLFTF
jgi:hypothetical protein